MNIYLSPSLQEKNIGVGDYGTEEKRCNQIANVVETVLQSHSVEVYRNTPDMTLSEVVKDSNSKKPDIHFAIHTNAFNSKARGMEIFCNKFGGEGHELAKNVYNTLSPLTPTSDRGVKEGYNFYNGSPMYELAYTTAPAALVEVAFHDNVQDATWIIDNIDPIGVVTAIGILNYFGIKYIDSTTSNIYRVVAGSFSARQNAEKQVISLKKAGFDSFIVKK